MYIGWKKSVCNSVFVHICYCHGNIYHGYIKNHMSKGIDFEVLVEIADSNTLRTSDP